ncbi:ORF33 [Plodia interpunctella granulovirus]|uniref:ORF33 n=1 Tax=Plodia interpunctella granulovirus TaxID=262175 RepID=A0A1L5JGX8_9BBAC|nr:ORF33 [Plodia interpunctella granulovirus]APO13917.1 ORF33 [Plodia interpunctella granulovirus]
MHEDILTLLKTYNKKFNELDDAFQTLKQQYDKTQYELKCVKRILKEVCSVVAPHREEMVQEMIDKHDKVYRTLYENGAAPLANIRFHHQLSPELNSVYLWNNIF